MAAQTTTSGAFSWANFGYETTYGTAAATFPRAFGQGVKITINQKNNMEQIWGLGNRNATANVAKKFEGNATVEFLLDAGDDAYTDGGNWFRGLLGKIPTDGGATPYTHAYAESDTLAPFSISTGAETGTLDAGFTLTGCKIASATISASVGEVATVKLDVPFMSIAYTSATNAITQVACSSIPLTFAQGTLTIGSTINYVQSVELTIKNNIEMLWGLGSRYATAGVEKKREYSVKMNVALSDTSALLEKFYGHASPVAGGAAGDLKVLNPAAQATLVLTFDNGLTVINSRKVVFTFANFYIDEHSLGLDVNEVVKEDVTGWALSCTSIVVSNATSTDIASP